jgi:hypothetical protein
VAEEQLAAGAVGSIDVRADVVEALVGDVAGVAEEAVAAGIVGEGVVAGRQVVGVEVVVAVVDGTFPGLAGLAVVAAGVAEVQK